MFVVFEGMDAAGKTTQIRLLCEFLSSLRLGCGVRLSREPGSTTIGTQIRNLVLHEDVDMRAEFLLYAADRAQNIASVVRPALESGDIVLQDRYTDSSIAYQAAGRGLVRHDVRAISRFATAGLVPQLTFIFDLDPAIALQRIRRRAQAGARPGSSVPIDLEAVGDRFEAMDLDFHARVRGEYLKIFEENKTNVCQFGLDNTRSEYCLINAENSIEHVFDLVRTRTLSLVERMG